MCQCFPQERLMGAIQTHYAMLNIDSMLENWTPTHPQASSYEAYNGMCTPPLATEFTYMCFLLHT